MAAVEIEVRRTLVGEFGVEVIELWWVDQAGDVGYAEIGYGIFEMKAGAWMLWAQCDSAVHILPSRKV